MKYVATPPAVEGRQLSFYLAMEEYVARRLPAEDYFFLWQVGPSVIFGRNQVMQNEVNVDYCREHGIEVFRRKSGGGCVYADAGNVMWSFITKEVNVGFAFNRFINMVLLVLRKIGIEGTGTSHNDVMIGHRKVCGTACYQVGGRNIVHSTMLYDTNMEHITNAITPSAEKLQAKGIESVRQRITLLKDHLAMNHAPSTIRNVADLKTLIRETLCNGELQLTQADVEAIGQLEREYLDRGFIQRM